MSDQSKTAERLVQNWGPASALLVSVPWPGSPHPFSWRPDWDGSLGFAESWLCHSRDWLRAESPQEAAALEELPIPCPTPLNCGHACLAPSRR